MICPISPFSTAIAFSATVILTAVENGSITRNHALFFVNPVAVLAWGQPLSKVQPTTNERLTLTLIPTLYHLQTLLKPNITSTPHLVPLSPCKGRAVEQHACVILLNVPLMLQSS